MDDMTPFDHQIARELRVMAGPRAHFDAMSIVRSVSTTHTPKWSFQPMFSATKFVVAGAIVALFGDVLLIVQPFGQEGERVPGAAGDVEAAAPVEFTATIRYGNGTGAEGVGFQVVASDPRFEGTLIRSETTRRFPGADIEVGVIRSRIENVGGAWQKSVGIHLVNVPDVESPPSGRREPESDPVTFVGVDGYEGLFVVAEETWDVMRLESDVHGYIFEGELPVALEPWSDELPPGWVAPDIVGVQARPANE